MAGWKQEVGGENWVDFSFLEISWQKTCGHCSWFKEIPTKRKVLLNILVFLRISWRTLGWILDPTPIKKAQKSSPVQEDKIHPPNHAFEIPTPTGHQLILFQAHFWLRGGVI